MKSAVVYLFTLSSLLTPILSSPVSNLRHPDGIPKRQAAPLCSAREKIPSLWAVDHLEINYTDDETVRPGNASFRLTDNLTGGGAKEELSCALRSNYVCEFKGTGLDKELGIWVQLNLGVASFTLTKGLEGCEGGR